jgi:hypothetical protein
VATIKDKAATSKSAVEECLQGGSVGIKDKYATYKPAVEECLQGGVTTIKDKAATYKPAVEECLVTIKDKIHTQADECWQGLQAMKDKTSMSKPEPVVEEEKAMGA